MPRQLFEQGAIGRDQDEIFALAFEPHAAVSADQLAEIDRQIGRDGEFAEAIEDGDHRFGLEAGGGGIPERERAEAIGVDVLGAFLQLGEGGERVAGPRDRADYRLPAAPCGRPAR